MFARRISPDTVAVHVSKDASNASTEVVGWGGELADLTTTPKSILLINWTNAHAQFVLPKDCKVTVTTGLTVSPIPESRTAGTTVQVPPCQNFHIVRMGQVQPPEGVYDLCLVAVDTSIVTTDIRVAEFAAQVKSFRGRCGSLPVHMFCTTNVGPSFDFHSGTLQNLLDMQLGSYTVLACESQIEVRFPTPEGVMLDIQGTGIYHRSISTSSRGLVRLTYKSAPKFTVLMRSATATHVFVKIGMADEIRIPIEDDLRHPFGSCLATLFQIPDGNSKDVHDVDVLMPLLVKLQAEAKGAVSAPTDVSVPFAFHVARIFNRAMQNRAMTVMPRVAWPTVPLDDDEPPTTFVRQMSAPPYRLL